MENASKALIMVAGVLIGILILSLAVYLFTSFGSTSAEVYKKNQENQLNQFNTQFTSYIGTDITIYDVITVANLATENNRFYEFPKRNTLTNGNDNYISVFLEGKGYIEGGNNSNVNSNYEELIRNDIISINDTNKELPRYTCTVQISTTTQKVYRVVFKKN